MTRGFRRWSFAIGLLAAAVTQAGAVVFSTSLVPPGGVSLGGGPHTYSQGLLGQGFDPGQYKVTGAVLTLSFDDQGWGTNDSVAVGFNGGPPSGVVQDPAGLWLESFQGQVTVDPALLQGGAPLDITLFSANALFTRSILAVQAERIGAIAPPPGTVLISQSQHLDALQGVNLAGSSHSFQHDIGLLGFDPAVDTVVDASLRLFFRDNTAGAAGNVEVQFDGGHFGGQISDAAGLFTQLFDETLNVGSAWLQDDGRLDVTLLPGDLTFLGSTLAFSYLHPAQAPEPPGLAWLALVLLAISGPRSIVGRRRRTARLNGRH